MAQLMFEARSSNENVLTPDVFDRAKEVLFSRPPEVSVDLRVYMTLEAYDALPDPENVTWGDLLELKRKGLL